MTKDIPTLLRELKDVTKWSELKLASEIGTSQPTVNRILNGQPDCKVRTLRRIEQLHAEKCSPDAQMDKRKKPRRSGKDRRVVPTRRTEDLAK